MKSIDGFKMLASRLKEILALCSCIDSEAKFTLNKEGLTYNRTGHREQYEKLKKSESQKLDRNIENFRKENAILAKETMAQREKERK
jgi:hypothetical protein